MVTLSKRINVFHQLGNLFKDICEKNDNSQYTYWVDLFNKKVLESFHHNNWFDKKNIYLSLRTWSLLLREKKISEWILKYDQKDCSKSTVAIIMAGNIPLVGFHDFLCASLLNFKIIIKMSSDDKVLLPSIIDFIETLLPGYKKNIKFSNRNLKNFDCIIATGNDNSFKYFKYYFNKYPSILRKNRHSIAVLSGDETKEELDLLSNDIFNYYGLGCRSISKILVPKNYSFDNLFRSFLKHKYVMENNRYMNNYDYNKAVYLMSDLNFLENGFKILKKDKKIGSPIACLFYENYDDIKMAKNYIENNLHKIQCVATNFDLKNKVLFGSTQNPKLNDYADNINTIDFLLKI